MTRHIFILIAILTLGCTKPNLEVPEFEEMAQCNKNSDIEKINHSDFFEEKFTVYWTDKAPEDCPGPKHPRIIVKHPDVSRWVHIIDVNITPPYREPFIGPSWNLTNDIDRWVYLDISEESIKERKLFYNETPSPVFHDNPKWSDKPKFEREWTGRLWGMALDHEGKFEPVLGLGWGFKNKKGDPNPEPIEPTQLERKQWNKDRALLRRLARKWKVKFPFY